MPISWRLNEEQVLKIGTGRLKHIQGGRNPRHTFREEFWREIASFSSDESEFSLPKLQLKTVKETTSKLVWQKRQYLQVHVKATVNLDAFVEFSVRE